MGYIHHVHRTFYFHVSVTTRSSAETVVAICLKGQVLAKISAQESHTLFEREAVRFSSDVPGSLVLCAQANSKIALISIKEIARDW